MAKRNLRNLLLYLALVILLLGVTGAWLVQRFAVAPARGPYLQLVTPDSIWVVWDTSQASIGRVEYGSMTGLGQFVEEKVAVRHHALQLVGLQPGTRYYYRVNKAQQAVFQTAPSPDQLQFRFVILGDTREGGLNHAALIRQILRVEPDFVLDTGDMVEFGDCKSCWDDFFRISAPLLRTAPLYPTLGNHEDDQSPFAGTHYFDIFHLPGVERWYAFDYGPARFISLKADGYPEGSYFPSSEQLDWLEGQLATADKPWLFVFFHWGVFTSRREDFLETGMRARLVPLFEKYGVDAVFTGHNHGYERVEVNGITYLTTAGGGAPLYDFTSPETGSQAVAKAYHFVLIDVNSGQAAGQVIDRRGQVIDIFSLDASQGK